MFPHVAKGITEPFDALDLTITWFQPNWTPHGRFATQCWSRVERLWSMTALKLFLEILLKFHTHTSVTLRLVASFDGCTAHPNYYTYRWGQDVLIGRGTVIQIACFFCKVHVLWRGGNRTAAYPDEVNRINPRWCKCVLPSWHFILVSHTYVRRRE